MKYLGTFVNHGRNCGLQFFSLLKSLAGFDKMRWNISPGNEELHFRLNLHGIFLILEISSNSDFSSWI